MWRVVWFNFRKRKILFKNPDTEIYLDGVFLKTSFRYFLLFLHMQWKWVFNCFNRNKPTISFYPSKPLPIYSLWNISKYNWFRISKNIEKANVVFYFEDDITWKIWPDIKWRFSRKLINFNCTDISKSNIQKVFYKVFWRRLDIDPLTFQWKAVEKSDNNWKHDWVIIDCPILSDGAKNWFVYQKLVDNSVDANTVMDIRCVVVNDKIPFIYLKYRPKEIRFTNDNSFIKIWNPNDYLSQEELDKIIKFTKELWLEFWEIDVLRDNGDWEIYIVDVNKTTLWPPASLKHRDKLKALKLYWKVFSEEFLDR